MLWTEKGVGDPGRGCSNGKPTHSASASKRETYLGDRALAGPPAPQQSVEDCRVGVHPGRYVGDRDTCLRWGLSGVPVTETRPA
jgi:hypothetical protein